MGWGWLGSRGVGGLWVKGSCGKGFYVEKFYISFDDKGYPLSRGFALFGERSDRGSKRSKWIPQTKLLKKFKFTNKIITTPPYFKKYAKNQPKVHRRTGGSFLRMRKINQNLQLKI